MWDSEGLTPPSILVDRLSLDVIGSPVLFS